MKENSKKCKSCGNDKAALVQYTGRNGKAIDVCKTCYGELREMNAFLDRMETDNKFSVMDADIQSEFRFIKLSFPAQIPTLDLSALNDTRKKEIPEDVFTNPRIAALHATLMQRALKADGITTDEIARTAQIPKQAARDFITCRFANPKVQYFLPFMQWVVAQEYTLNHIMQREDIDELLDDNAQLEGAALESTQRSNIRAALIVFKSKTNYSQQQMSELLGISLQAYKRASSGKYWKQLSPKYWLRIERALQEHAKK
jgi:hypothetical protein